MRWECQQNKKIPYYFVFVVVLISVDCFAKAGQLRHGCLLIRSEEEISLKSAYLTFFYSKIFYLSLMNEMPQTCQYWRSFIHISRQFLSTPIMCPNI